MRAAQVHEVNYSYSPAEKHNTPQMAAAWGRTAATQGWGLDLLADEVAAEFHEVARKAYSLKLKNLARAAKCR